MTNIINLIGILSNINDFNDNKTIDIKINNENNDVEILYDIYISDSIFNSMKRYCKIGDIIGIKAHFKSNKIVCDRISFLSHTRKRIGD